MFIRNRVRGISLIELVMFIVIVGAALAGVLLVMSTATKSSADPLVRKQALAAAESLLEEIELQAFTYCLPSDPLATTATSASGCTGGVGSSEDTLPASTRVASAPSARDANNVADYNNFSMTPIADITGSTVGGLAGYTASVKIAQAGAIFSLPAAEVLQIDVRVQSGPTDLTLTGYRFRYAPKAVP
jgi:MSHA pilin protein MshD